MSDKPKITGPELVPLSAIFSIEHGHKLDLNKTEACPPSKDGAIAFVGRSGERNGVVAFVSKIDTKKPYESGLITVALGGSTLASFVQTSQFYTGQNVDVLRPLSAMSLEIKLYYCLCIEANRFRYSTFGREANRTLRNLAVPARSSVPQWVSGLAKTAVDALSKDLNKILFP
jgi:hypothetical protein